MANTTEDEGNPHRRHLDERGYRRSSRTLYANLVSVEDQLRRRHAAIDARQHTFETGLKQVAGMLGSTQLADFIGRKIRSRLIDACGATGELRKAMKEDAANFRKFAPLKATPQELMSALVQMLGSVSFEITDACRLEQKDSLNLTLDGKLYLGVTQTIQALIRSELLHLGIKPDYIQEIIFRDAGGKNPPIASKVFVHLDSSVLRQVIETEVNKRLTSPQVKRKITQAGRHLHRSAEISQQLTHDNSIDGTALENDMIENLRCEVKDALCKDVEQEIIGDRLEPPKKVRAI